MQKQRAVIYNIAENDEEKSANRGGGVGTFRFGVGRYVGGSSWRGSMICMDTRPGTVGNS
jgi:hypothetical protein